MKYLHLVLCLAAIALCSTLNLALADSFDSETATLQKKSNSMATVMVAKDKFTTPISFDDGASWDSVKDHYEMNPSAVSGLKDGKMMISVGSDGTLSYKPCMKNCSMGMSSMKK